MLRIQDPQLRQVLSFIENSKECVFLDTSKPDGENSESLLFSGPIGRVLCASGDSQAAYLDELQNHLENGYHLAGWVGYEFGAMLEERGFNAKKKSAGAGDVLADFGVFPEPFRFDHFTGKNNFPFHEEPVLRSEDSRVSNLRPNMTKEEFVAALDVVQQYIAAGDTYQVNYTLKLLFDFEGSAEELYCDLRRNQSVAYGAYLRNGQDRILSFSPELFFKKNSTEVTVRPMKGTAKRGFYGEEDRKYCSDLQYDIKNRSENVMIVDLLRNDLGRLMHGHGESRVFVESLFDVESFESLLQMTSTIKAQATEETMQSFRLTDIFRALFPCGSITGAPKIRTMQIIDELEKDQRGVYTGAIGYFAPDGSAAFNVPIRTIRLRGNHGEMGIGAGITHDSVPADEWKESLLKGRFLTHSQPFFRLFETILWQPGTGYWLLDQHLQRLEQAAEYFKYSYHRDIVLARLGAEAEGFAEGYYRVRLSLEKDGRLICDTARCDKPVSDTLPANPEAVVTGALPVVTFSSQVAITENPWCFHKTTMRQLYDAEYAEARNEGVYDRLFRNKKGEVTEGCISNVIIYERGQYRTPPVRCGLLAGVMRGRLLRSSGITVSEDVLTEEMVRAAEAVYLCNSVRGVVQVAVR